MFISQLLESGVAPRKYINRHTIKLERIATIDLNLEEVSEMLHKRNSAILRRLTFFALICHRSSKSSVWA